MLLCASGCAMSWDAVGAIGELVGSLAVLVTLAYVAIQVRHTRAQLEVSIQQKRYDTFRELLLETLRNPELRRTYDKTGKVYSAEIQSLDELFQLAELTREEMAMFRNHQLAFWQYRIETIEQIQNLTQVQKDEFDRGIRRIYGSSPARLWYETVRKNGSNPEAVKYIDAVLAQGALPGLYQVSDEAGT